MVLKLGLPTRINDALRLLKMHRSYHESDHVLNVAYNLLCGGRTLDGIEYRRQCQAYLDTLGARSISGPNHRRRLLQALRRERNLATDGVHQRSAR